MAEKVRKIKKTTILLAGTVLLVLVAYLIYKGFGKQIVDIVEMLERGDQDEIMAYLAAQTSFKGFLYLFLLSVIQIISVVLPCLVIQVAGALIFGWWKAFLICWAGFVCGNMVVFLGMRIFGKGLRLALDKSYGDNWLIKKLNSKNPIFAVAMSCMIPGIPNGIIPYIAANTAISAKQYFIAITFSSWIQIVLNCIAGGFLAQGRISAVVIVFMIEFVIIFIMNKNKDSILEKFERN